ncbi:MAG: F0F1 ATP synthase subunit A [Candidatus Peribacteria bacterium]|jgi:F-type H+-transporting ATPase subunit a|nr:F0F1 ATP synthase subunit A [Candidatus Peribacteria bacterium]
MATLKKQKGKRQKKFVMSVEYLVESISTFFEEILGEKAPFWIKSYITNLFLVILIANLLGLVLDILVFPFPRLGQYLQNPTGDLSFTLALAVCSMLMVLFVEVKTKGWGRCLYGYFPIFGTNLFHLSPPASRGSYVLRPLAKLFDIVISLFIGLLNIIGIIAKVISLAFRLYGNMMAGALLLTIIMGMLGPATKTRLSGWELPLLVPLVFYVQSALTAVVQAFVFSLLTSVFIRMHLEGGEEKKLKVDSVSQELVKQML